MVEAETARSLDNITTTGNTGDSGEEKHNQEYQPGTKESHDEGDLVDDSKTFSAVLQEEGEETGWVPNDKDHFLFHMRPMECYINKSTSGAVVSRDDASSPRLQLSSQDTGGAVSSTVELEDFADDQASNQPNEDISPHSRLDSLS